MAESILFVDDEPAVLSGYERILRREFNVTTAVGAAAGMDCIRDGGPFAVVVSDMRMPVTNGAQFLAKVREQSPDSVRMLLTGFTDLNAAIDAVNQGNIFRFLTKPCEKEVLLAALQAGVEQYQLIRAEKELLEKTLLGSIRVLADFLSVSNPAAFGRSMRIAQWVRHIATGFRLEFGWRLEAAATLSHLGCVTLDASIVQRAFAGIRLEPEEQARFNAHPETAMRLLSGIPRLEPVAWIIGQQLNAAIPCDANELPLPARKETVLCAKILKLAVAFDNLRSAPMPDMEAISRLRSRTSEFERELVDALIGVKPEGGRMEPRRVPTYRLTTGMVLDQEVRNKQGNLIATQGQEITRAVLAMLTNHADAGLIDREVMALVPV